MALADVYDALVSKRCYKTAFARQEALDMIRDNKCGVFNPRLLDRFFAGEEKLARLYPRRSEEN